MNGKKARMCRRIARQVSIGEPERDLRHYGRKLKSGGTKYLYAAHAAGSTRERYRQIKREYQRRTKGRVFTSRYGDRV